MKTKSVYFFCILIIIGFLNKEFHFLPGVFVYLGPILLGGSFTWMAVDLFKMEGRHRTIFRIFGVIFTALAIFYLLSLIAVVQFFQMGTV